jgi:hypothetical protein
MLGVLTAEFPKRYVARQSKLLPPTVANHLMPLSSTPRGTKDLKTIHPCPGQQLEFCAL